MESPKHLTIAIIDTNPLFSEMLKKSILSGIEITTSIHPFTTPETFFKNVESNRIQPDVIILDYKLNIQCDEEFPCKKNIEHIRRTIPEAALIVISDEKDMLEAAKTLQLGAHEFVLKDKFVFSHITSTLHGVLNPSRS